MYLIIVGAGDIGTPLIELSTGERHETVVIEKDEDRANHIANTYDCMVINADATSKSTLDDAGADEADAILSTTNKDATNVMVSLLADQLDIPEIISVVYDHDHIPLFREIGVNTIENPEQLIAEHLYRAVTRPSIIDYMRVGKTAEVFEITIDEDAPIAGKTIQEASDENLLTDDILIVALERGDEEDLLTPRGGTTLYPGDLLTVYSDIGVTPEVTDIFGHYEDHD